MTSFSRILGQSWKSSPEAILLGKMAHHTKQIRRECISYYLDTFALYTSLCNFQCRRKIWERGDRSSQDLGRLATPIPVIRGQIMPTNIFDNPAALLSIYYLEPHSYFARLQTHQLELIL